ncbi:phosphodiester glycosidase family protein [Salimicrobium halophilum]|uniref:S-layer homology domain-containing protein n=1 Tax=Salimicrobium halophilum TaxID=86666 RepID=A0A1G8S4L7_9BACI|nr:phosphodiester glycosidase family protein [Salimicrobium halophilum]SDJ24167.1 S-layer homology domain-containing protein [Salimicrobium halophilum]
MRERQQRRVMLRWMLLVVLAILPLAGTGVAEASTVSISDGVTFTKDRYSGDAVQISTMDITDPFTEVHVGIPNPLDRLQRTSDHANSYIQPQRQVVSAMNGSFFNTDLLPMYLISYKNRLVNAGIVASGRDQYVNEPIAFGIDRNGEGMIDHYDLDLSFDFNEETYTITSTNKQRSDNSLIMFTPSNPSSTTETNPYGKEVVFEVTEGEEMDLEFGSTIEAEVVGFRDYGTTQSATIPENGFVLSAHGQGLVGLRPLAMGDEIELSVDIDEKWEESSFMLAGGPQLVKDGRVDLSIDPGSSRAREVAPRSAVAVDEDGGEVYFVTVDGRQSHSNGMNLSQFADYIANELGAEAALNMDGGGSTTMAIRQLGKENVVVSNSPSDGQERYVSTILMGVSTAPEGDAENLVITPSHTKKMLKGSSLSFTPHYVMDEYGNPLDFNISELDYDVSGIEGNFNGNTFTAQTTGQGSITATYREAVREFGVEVVDELQSLTVAPSALNVAPGQTEMLQVSATAKDGSEVVTGASSIEWTTKGDIGSIQNGTFEAVNYPAEGEIVASYGNITKRIPVKVGGEASNLHNMETLKFIEGDADSTLSLSEKEFSYEGNYSVKWSYDTADGTAAISFADNYRLSGPVKKLGLRVFGNAQGETLSAVFEDTDGETAEITLTENVNWNGWKYVEATLPESMDLPISIDSLNLSGSQEGHVYLDDVKAIYDMDYKEASYKDTGLSFWAETEVSTLVNQGVISGYPDGTFKPNRPLDRLQAAILLTRALDLDTEDVASPGFSDVPESYRFYDYIAAAYEAGIIQGKQGGEIYDRTGLLTRAEMAVIMQRAFNLESDGESYFSDNNSNSFAYDAIRALAANNITQGFNDGTYRPSEPLTRTEFSVFLYRALQ